MKPTSNEAPTNQDLAVFINKEAGIKIQETEPNDKGITYNWVSEIHIAAGFQNETGRTMYIEHSPMVDSAFGRNPAQASKLEDDLPF